MKKQLLASNNFKGISADNFIESRFLRDANVVRIEVLNKVKALTMLPDDTHVTVDMAASYYEVPDFHIRTTINRHRDELTKDGLKTLRGEELKEFKEIIAIHNVSLNAKANLLIIPRRALLRIGMLLRDSEVAKQVRSYLLNVEQITRKEAPQITRKALMQLLKERDQELKQLKTDYLVLYKINQVLAPKAEIYDHFMGEENSYSMDEVAKILKVEHMGRNKLFSMLRDNGILLKDDQRNVPLQKYIDAGYFVVVLTKWEVWDYWKERLVTMTIPVTRVLPKGINFIRQLLLQSGYRFNIAN